MYQRILSFLLEREKDMGQKKSNEDRGGKKGQIQL